MSADNLRLQVIIARIILDRRQYNCVKVLMLQHNYNLLATPLNKNIIGFNLLCHMIMFKLYYVVKIEKSEKSNRSQ